MAKDDIEYTTICDEIENILDMHPTLRHVLEDEKAFPLTEDDTKALIKINTLYMQKRDIDMINLFYLGGNNMYYYLTKTRIINEKSNEIKD